MPSDSQKILEEAQRAIAEFEQHLMQTPPAHNQTASPEQRGQQVTPVQENRSVFDSAPDPEHKRKQDISFS